jgi:hypothetical protein
MIRNYIIHFLIVSILIFTSLQSCKKKETYGKGNLHFSQDTIVFDTVFTTIGSTTKQFKIYNKDNNPLNIEEIELIGGENSPFRINIDGNSGTLFNNIKILSRDSLFGFIDVKLRVNNQIYPMVIEDKIRFKTNGVTKYITLVVWGQDIYYHYSDMENGNLLDLNEGIWPNDKPHLIYGAAFVDEGKTLNIQAGTKVYFHKNAKLFIYKGTLNINGELNNEVTFEGDRLEEEYNNIRGQYYGIYFDSARPSSINYLNLKNGTNGIHLFDNNNSNGPFDYTLTVKNSKIYNNENNGILIYKGARIKVENTIISNNAGFGFLLLHSGGFNFNHCNILGYNSASKSQAFGILNYFDNTISPLFGSISEGKVTNSIIYGNQDVEFTYDIVTNQSPVSISLDFQHNLIQTDTNNQKASFFVNGNIFNSNPMFTNILNFDFTLQPLSPAIGKANNSFPTSNGLNIKGESISPANIGAY